MLGRMKKALGRDDDSADVPKNSKPADSDTADSPKDKSATNSAQKGDPAASSRQIKPINDTAQHVAGSRTQINDTHAIVRQAPKSISSTQMTPKTENRSIPVKGEGSKPKPQTMTVNNSAGKKKGNRRPKNTVVISLQMPVTLVKVLDEIVDLGGYRSRSDIILQAVRSHTDVSKRLALLKPNQPQLKK